MCHACLLGERKYVHELPDPTSLVVKTEDLINGEYEWDPEYFEAHNSGGGIIITEEQRKESELHKRMTEVINENFPHEMPFNLNFYGIR